MLISSADNNDAFDLADINEYKDDNGYIENIFIYQLFWETIHCLKKN